MSNHQASAQKLAQAVREKKTAQALGAAERLSAERWERGMDVAKTAAGVAAVGLAAKQGAGEAARTAATLAATL